MNNKAHLRPKDYDSNGGIIPMACKEEKGDLISRKWLTDAIRNRRTYLSYEDAKDVIDLIDNAPTVKTYCYFCGQTEHGQVVPDTLQGWKYEERPQGKWIYTPNIIGLSEYEGITCSICGNDSVGDFNYCPNCGANMRKGGAE